MLGSNDKRPAVERVKPPDAMIKIANPIMRWILGSPLHGLFDEHLLLLHFRGRKTGHAYTVVVGHRNVDGRMGILTNSGWRVNLRGDAPVEVTLKGGLRRGRAELVEEPEKVARVYADLIGEYGYQRAGRRLGIRINVDRMPSREELIDLVWRTGLSVVVLNLEDGGV
jgi:hypothetical protein